MLNCAAVDRRGPIAAAAVALRGLEVIKAEAILVAAGSGQVRDRIVAILADAGIVTQACDSVGEACERIATDQPPLAIFAIAKWDHESFSACRVAKANHPEVFLVHVATEADGDASLEPYFDACLSEPIRPPDLGALVRTLLRLHDVEADLRHSEQRLALAQEAAEIAVLDWDMVADRFVQSDRFAELFDLPSHGEHGGLAAEQILSRIHPDDMAMLIAEFGGENRTERHFDLEFRIVRRNGCIRWISSRGRFFASAAGVPQRMLALSFDVTQRKEGTRVNAELAAIVASARDAIISIDGVGSVLSWNAGAERLFGRPAADVLGHAIGEAIPGLMEEGAIRSELLDDATHEFEFRHRSQPDAAAEIIDMGVTSAPIRATEDRPLGTSLIIRDMSAQKQREDHVRFLMRELTHRSKNLLAVIQAMARQSVTRDIAPEEFVRRFTDRLAGLAGSHDLLSSVDWRGASLLDLVRSQLKHYEELFGTRILLEDEDLFIRPEAAQNIGIALHELSTNAAKYGALSTEAGLVRIRWRVAPSAASGADMLTVRWQEENGPRVVAPTRKGFGHVVMERIAGRALGGSSAIEFCPEGVLWMLEVPASTALAMSKAPSA